MTDGPWQTADIRSATITVPLDVSESTLNYFPSGPSAVPPATFDDACEATAGVQTVTQVVVGFDSNTVKAYACAGVTMFLSDQLGLDILYHGSLPAGVDRVEYEQPDGSGSLAAFEDDPRIFIAVDATFGFTLNDTAHNPPTHLTEGMTVQVRQNLDPDVATRPGAVLDGYPLIGSVAASATYDEAVVVEASLDPSIIYPPNQSPPSRPTHYWSFTVHHDAQISHSEPAHGPAFGTDESWGQKIGLPTSLELSIVFRPPRYRFVGIAPNLDGAPVDDGLHFVPV